MAKNPFKKRTAGPDTGPRHPVGADGNPGKEASKAGLVSGDDGSNKKRVNINPPSEDGCVNPDGHRFATNRKNDKGTYDVYCKECGLVTTSEVAH